MQLTGLQLAAILKAGKLMVLADGKVKMNELKVLAHEMSNFNVPESQVQGLLSAADTIEASEMVKILSSLDSNIQKYVCGYLAVIILSDGNIDDSEVKMWKLLCTMCSFPVMSISEALDFWAKN